MIRLIPLQTRFESLFEWLLSYPNVLKKRWKGTHSMVTSLDPSSSLQLEGRIVVTIKTASVVFFKYKVYVHVYVCFVGARATLGDEGGVDVSKTVDWSATGDGVLLSSD